MIEWIAPAVDSAKRFWLQRRPSWRIRGQDWIDEVTQDTAVRLMAALRCGHLRGDQRRVTNYAIGLFRTRVQQRAIAARRAAKWQVDGHDEYATGADFREISRGRIGDWQSTVESDWAFKAADACPMYDRILWAMVDVLDMDTVEVARAMGATPHSVQTMVGRVRRALRAAWNEGAAVPMRGRKTKAKAGLVPANRDAVYT